MDAISRRSLLGSAAALAAGAALAACGLTRPGGGRPLTLTLAGTGQRSLFTHMIPRFEAAHPGIRVQWGLTSGGQAATLRDQILAAVGPDVFWLEDPGPYLLGGLLRPLDDLIRASAYHLADFPDAALGTMRQGGHLYGLPRSAATGAYMVNVELVNAAGLPRPEDGYAAADMAALWNRMTGNGVVGGQLAWSPEASFYLNGWGGHLVDPGDATRCALDSAPDLACGRWMFTQLRESGCAQGLQGQQPAADFPQGTLGMQVVSARGALAAAGRAVNLPWRFLPFPVWPAGRATFIQTDAYALSAVSPHTEAAWALLQFVSSPAWQAQAIATDFVPPPRLSLWPTFIRTLEATAPPLAGRGLDVFVQPLRAGWAKPQERFANNPAAEAALAPFWPEIFGPTGQLPVGRGFAQAVAAVTRSQAAAP